MLNIELDMAKSIAILTPRGPLSENDFENAAGMIDPYIEKFGGLRGLIIKTRTFPGWESLGALVRHLEFIKTHHGKVFRIALVTDSRLADVAEKAADRLIDPQVRYFAFDEFDKAENWIAGAE